MLYMFCVCVCARAHVNPFLYINTVKRECIAGLSKHGAFPPLYCIETLGEDYIINIIRISHFINKSLITNYSHSLAIRLDVSIQ